MAKPSLKLIFDKLEQQDEKLASIHTDIALIKQSNDFFKEDYKLTKSKVDKHEGIINSIKIRVAAISGGIGAGFGFLGNKITAWFSS